MSAPIVNSFARGIANLAPTCKTAARLQSDALDRPLTWTQRVGLQIHLLLCKWCRRYGRQLKFLCHAAHEHPDEMTAPLEKSLSPEACERLKQKLAGK